jgi:hypothetical protein
MPFPQQFCIATIPLVYLFSHLFINPFTARVVTLIVAYVGGPLLPINSFFLNLGGGVAKTVNTGLIPLYRIFPGYSLGTGLLNMAAQSTGQSAWDSDITGVNIATLFWTSAVYLIAVIVLEYLISVPRIASTLRRWFGTEIYMVFNF